MRILKNKRPKLTRNEKLGLSIAIGLALFISIILEFTNEGNTNLEPSPNRVYSQEKKDEKKLTWEQQVKTEEKRRKEQANKEKEFLHDLEDYEGMTKNEVREILGDPLAETGYLLGKFRDVPTQELTYSAINLRFENGKLDYGYEHNGKSKEMLDPIVYEGIEYNSSTGEIKRTYDHNGKEIFYYPDVMVERTEEEIDNQLNYFCSLRTKQEMFYYINTPKGKMASSIYPNLSSEIITREVGEPIKKTRTPITG